MILLHFVGLQMTNVSLKLTEAYEQTKRANTVIAQSFSRHLQVLKVTMELGHNLFYS